MDDVYDYVIIGAGGAGCVLANRLSESPGTSVLLVEAGPTVLDPMLIIPKGLYFLLMGGKYAYKYATLPAGPQHAEETWLRGNLVGGGTSINGMQYHRGEAEYWDQLAAAGNAGWGWQDMARVFREIEDHEYGATETRGAGGPLGIQISRQADELTEMLLQAGVAAGLTRVDDINEPGAGDRIGLVPNTVRRGRRASAATAFLSPVRTRPNLRIATDTRAGYLTFDGDRASGVRLRHRGRLRDVRARREVIVSAGAIETPLLLERSGIGQGEALRRAGVPVRVESPRLGEGLREQRLSGYQAKISRRLGFNHKLSTPLNQVVQGVGYLASGKGIISTGAYEIAAVFSSGPDAPMTDLMSLINPFSLDLSGPGMAVAKDPGFQINGQLLNPTTESSVHLTGADPDAPPVIEPHYLETEYDRAATPKLVEFARRLAAQSPIADIVTEEEIPGAAVTTDEELVMATWMGPNVFHATGSAGMGVEPDAVVDPELRVRGVRNLRIADISVLPQQPGNTAGPAMALGWRAADTILG